MCCRVWPNGDPCVPKSHRLGKSCQPSDSVRQRGVEKKVDTSAKRIAELESKVNSLLTQLRSPGEANLTGRVRQSTTDEHVMPSIEVDIDEDIQNETADLDKGEKTRQKFRNGCLLDKFRSKMLPNLPFIHLPVTITAEELETEWPILFRVIMFVASETPGRLTRRQGIKRSICDSLLEIEQNPKNSKRTGLLLAILTYLAWGYGHAFHDGSMPRLMAQAVSLATEMIQSDYADSGSLMEPAAQFFGHDRQRDVGGTTRRDFFLDRRRAMLVCFVLNSAVSTYFGRINTFQWTRQMEESLAMIANKDCASDGDFSRQIRLQLLAEKALQILRQQRMEYRNSMSGAAVAPGIMSLMSLQNELQGFRAALPPQVIDRKLVMAHVYSTESRLGQIIYTISSTSPVMISQWERMLAGMSAGASIEDGTSETRPARSDQILGLWQCLQSSKDCVLALLDWEPDKFCHMSFLQWSQLAQGVARLYHLTHTIEDQGWDRETVRARTDMPTILDRIVDKLQAATEMNGPGQAGNAFGHLPQKMIEIRNLVAVGDTQQNTSHREADAALGSLKVNGGGRGTSPCNITRLGDTFKYTRGPFDYVFWVEII